MSKLTTFLHFFENQNIIEIQETKKQEKSFTHLGVGHRPFRNAKLYEMDVTTFKVIEILLEDKKELVLTETKDQQKSLFRAYINNSNVHVWALNKKNAFKKFKKNMNIHQKTNFDKENGIS
jgi:hypothetical protein